MKKPDYTKELERKKDFQTEFDELKAEFKKIIYRMAANAKT